jgi:hypothetical protein
LDRTAARPEVRGGGEVNRLWQQRMGIRLCDLHQLFGVAIGQLVEQHSLYNTEICAVGSHTEGERKDGHDRKGGGFPQLPESVTDVSEHVPSSAC